MIHSTIFLFTHPPNCPPTHPCTNPHIISLTGKRTVRVKEVPTQASSLTQGDVYILDAGLLIYIFCGPTANMFEKTKGTCVCVCVYLFVLLLCILFYPSLSYSIKFCSAPSYSILHCSSPFYTTLYSGLYCATLFHSIPLYPLLNVEAALVYDYMSSRVKAYMLFDTAMMVIVMIR